MELFLIRVTVYTRKREEYISHRNYLNLHLPPRIAYWTFWLVHDENAVATAIETWAYVCH